MRPIRISTAVSAALLALVPSTAAAHDGDGGDHRLDPARIAALPSGTSLPLVTSPNVRFHTNVPDTAGISGCFAKTAPYFYVSSVDSISVYDASDPLRPTLTGVLDNIVFENEAMNCGERRGRHGVERFVLVGNNLADASSSDPEGSAGSVLKDELIVVDVTDPTAPRIRSRVETTTGDHTVACIKETACDFAYSSGGRRSFSVIDLRDLDHPVEVDSAPATPGTQPFTSPTGGHKWNFDDAGFGVHTGYDGSGIFDVRDPAAPRLVTTTGAAGRGLADDGTRNGYNDFIHHNSFRPNAASFRPDAPPSLANGNILLVTEEDYEDVNCATAGSFQTWHVKRLDGTPDAVVPLDKVELADLGTYPLPAGGFCSAHWFDLHPSGIAAVGFYGGGVQLVDVRDPQHLTSYGHATWGASEVWDSYWVPVYNKNGTATGKRTNVLYTVDLVRGLDVYSVDLPGTASSPSDLPISLAGAVSGSDHLPLATWLLLAGLGTAASLHHLRGRAPRLSRADGGRAPAPGR